MRRLAWKLWYTFTTRGVLEHSSFFSGELKKTKKKNASAFSGLMWIRQSFPQEDPQINTSTWPPVPVPEKAPSLAFSHSVCAEWRSGLWHNLRWFSLQTDPGLPLGETGFLIVPLRKERVVSLTKTKKAGMRKSERLFCTCAQEVILKQIQLVVQCL